MVKGEKTGSEITKVTFPVSEHAMKENENLCGREASIRLFSLGMTNSADRNSM
ncbi:hypothetical protein V7201_22240 [Bacillus sp. JJ1122]|uniref:hypothetical protein n=1 Tax=Bacillus sp. JJ1122 TaxID=3122951 RepID=UPI002FFFEF3E